MTASRSIPRKGQEDSGTDSEIIVANDDAEFIDDGRDDLARAVDALEDVDWGSVESVSATTAATFTKALRNAGGNE